MVVSSQHGPQSHLACPHLFNSTVVWTRIWGFGSTWEVLCVSIPSGFIILWAPKLKTVPSVLYRRIVYLRLQNTTNHLTTNTEGVDFECKNPNPRGDPTCVSLKLSKALHHCNLSGSCMYFKLIFWIWCAEKRACRTTTHHQAVGLKHAITKCSLCIFKLDMSDLCLRLVRISEGLIWGD